MIASELILKLLKSGVILKLDNENLIVEAPSGIIDADLIEELKTKKAEIIELLKLKQRNTDYYQIEKSVLKATYKLSPAQLRLFLLQEIQTESTAYNIPFMIPVDFEVNVCKISQIFEKLIHRHESLRTGFELENGTPVQRIHDSVEFSIEEFFFDSCTEKGWKEKFIQCFDLSKPPLLRVALATVDENEKLLMIDMHHIISDGVSHAILEREFRALYSGEALSPLKLQYRDYSEWQQG
ncbi:MAG: condensation domain-containing protein, partial [Marinifilaceae bacterium]